MRLPSWTLAGGRFQLRLFNFSPARSRLRPALHRRLLVRLTAPNGLIFFDLFSTPLGRSVKGLAPHCNKCQFSTRFQRADDRSTPAENSGPGARASDPVLVFELQDLRRSYWQYFKVRPLSRCGQDEAKRTGSRNAPSTDRTRTEA